MKLEERLKKYLQTPPNIDDSVYIAENAIIIGAVTIKPKASVWHHCVLRADIHSIEIGEGTNVQDGSVIHLSDEYGVSIGNYVTVGHRAIIHACRIEDECLIGMNATIMDGAEIGKYSIIGACALITKNQKIPPGSLVIGNPAKVVRSLTLEEQKNIRLWADKYVTVAKFHKDAPLRA